MEKTAGRRNKKIEFEKEDAFDGEKLHNAVYKMAKDVRWIWLSPLTETFQLLYKNWIPLSFLYFMLYRPTALASSRRYFPLNALIFNQQQQCAAYPKTGENTTLLVEAPNVSPY